MDQRGSLEPKFALTARILGNPGNMNCRSPRPGTTLFAQNDLTEGVYTRYRLVAACEALTPIGTWRAAHEWSATETASAIPGRDIS